MHVITRILILALSLTFIAQCLSQYVPSPFLNTNTPRLTSQLDAQDILLCRSSGSVVELQRKQDSFESAYTSLQFGRSPEHHRRLAQSATGTASYDSRYQPRHESFDGSELALLYNYSLEKPLSCTQFCQKRGSPSAGSWWRWPTQTQSTRSVHCCRTRGPPAITSTTESSTALLQRCMACRSLNSRFAHMLDDSGC